jgi:hypothetical protein
MITCVGGIDRSMQLDLRNLQRSATPTQLRGYSARVGGTLLFSGVRPQRVRKPLLVRYSGGLDAGIPKRSFGNSSPLNSVVPSCSVLVLPPAKPGFPSHGSHLGRVRWATVRPRAAQLHREAFVADGGRSRLATT